MDSNSSEAPREARPQRFNPTHPEEGSVVAAETPLVSSTLAASLGNLTKTRYYYNVKISVTVKSWIETVYQLFNDYVCTLKLNKYFIVSILLNFQIVDRKNSGKHCLFLKNNVGFVKLPFNSSSGSWCISWRHIEYI